MNDEARELIENCAALLLDFDGPMTRLLPPPRNAELAQAVRAPLIAAGVDLPEEVEASTDHLAVLRYVAANAPELLDEVERIAVDGEVHAAEVSKPTEGLSDLLRKHGHKTIVVTNNAPEAAQAFLDRLGDLSSGVLVCGRPAGRPDLMKPSPYLVTTATAAAAANPSDCILVGDHASDALAARGAETGFLGFITSPRHLRELKAAGATSVTSSWNAPDFDVALAVSRALAPAVASIQDSGRQSLAALTDNATLRRSLQSLMDSYRQSVNTVTARLNEFVSSAVFESIREPLSALSELLRAAQLPRNLRPIDGLTNDQVIEFTLIHGISLYLVPRTSLARRLLAETGNDRKVRRILVSERTSILYDCATLLKSIETPTLIPIRDMTLQSVKALDNDLYAPSQALSANILDYLLRGVLNEELHKTCLRKKAESEQEFRERIHELEAWERYVASAVWVSFAHYRASEGDPVPYKFSRHATTHAVAGGRQYSRTSAVQALLAVSGCLAFLDGDW